MIKNLAVVLMLVCALAACKKEKPKDVVLNATPTTRALANGMPRLTMNMTDGTNVTMTDLNGKVLLVCYNPSCDHCQREAKVLSEHKDLFDGYEVYFLTPETLEEAAKFQHEYNLEEPNIHFGRAEVPAILPAIGVISTVPTFFVYQDQALVKRLEGELPIDSLRDAME
ncbi:MAG TPA: redoxin domain-containing protein [Cyclobacteriaceae bacterium]